MRTQIGLLNGATDWMLCGMIIAVACIGKFGPAPSWGRLTGLPWQEACSIGVLMSLDLGVISPRLFTMLVIMAVVTTVLTSPLLHLLERNTSTPALSNLRHE